MSNAITAADAAQLKECEQVFQSSQQQLMTAQRWRTMRSGYVVDESDEAYRLACRDFTQAKIQLVEQQRKVTLDRTKRKPVLKLIDKLKDRSALDTTSVGHCSI